MFFIILFSCAEKKSTESKTVRLDFAERYRQAFAYLEEDKLDSAFIEFEQVKNLAIEAKDSLNAANCLIQMAITLREVGDYLTSQELSLEANNYLDTSKSNHAIYISSNYNNLGNVTDELNDYERAIQFYDQAIRYSTDSMNTKVFLNNKARTLSGMGKERQALQIYEYILDSESKNEIEYARALTNYAGQRARIDKRYDAFGDLNKALGIRLANNDKWGINSSFAYLALYYESKDIDSALYYAHKRYDIATRLNSVDDRLDALNQLIAVSPAIKAKTYFKDYKVLSDSIQLVRSKAKNQFALIRYEVEKNKADNLKLQKDVDEKMYRINMQRLLTLGLSTVFIITGVFSVIWYRRRKQRLFLEANNKIKANQLKTSRKVHDVVANGLYRVMAEIENREDIDRDGILDRLESMYEKSRDISYEVEEDPPTDQQAYHEFLGELLRSYATESRTIILAGNDVDLWACVSDKIKSELGHVLQELMVNMRKHSQADRVILRFELIENVLNIQYADNGVGLSKNLVKGNGLKSTGTRIENINGNIKFASETSEGLKVHISIPVL